MRQNDKDAIRYYEHALVVLEKCCEDNKIEVDEVLRWIDLSKVHVSLAQIYR
jgi:hypothetical protein